MKTRVIVNPNAGSVDDLAALRRAVESLPGAEMVTTAAAGDAERLAREAVSAEIERVVAAGGDGTLNEVVNGLAAGLDRVQLGLLPLGTGNDLARAIGVPADLEGALEVLAAGQVRPVDVCRVSAAGYDRLFLNMSAGGFSDAVAEQMTDDLKSRWGPLAYLRGALGALADITPFATAFRLDGGERLAVDAYSVVVSNGRYVAGGIPVSPRAVLDDGLLDLMIVPATTVPRLAALLPQVLLGRHAESDLLVFRRARRLEIASTPAMVFNADGETAGETPLVFEVLPRALTMIVGEAEEGVWSTPGGAAPVS